MRLYEFEAKQVLARAGITIPRSYGLVKSGRSTTKLKANWPAMLKAQVLVGGRGKAGGIKKADSPTQAVAVSKEILSRHIGGYPVGSVLVEEAIDYSGACYVGVTMNPATFNSVIMVSASGGVDIEQVARTKPEAIMRLELTDNPDSLPKSAAVKLAEFLTRDPSIPSEMKSALANLAVSLYGVYQDFDCKVVEINPLLITPMGPIAADAKMVLDDNALFRHSDLLQQLAITAKRHEVAEPTARERQSSEQGFPYVDLLPENTKRQKGKVYVGLVPGGAGYGIFSIDETTGIGEEFFDGRAMPVNFMDSGGGPTTQRVAQMFSLLMDYPLVDVIVTSRFGGISSCDVFIRGLVDCLRQRGAAGKRVVPVYGRMVGTDLPAARSYLETARVETPQELEPLSMIVGNRKIMAEVIKEAIEDFLASKEGVA